MPEATPERVMVFIDGSNFYLVSGDGDFASVVHAVKGFGRRVEVAYVAGRPAYHLRQVCDVFVELSVDLLRSLTLSQRHNLHE